MGLKLRYVCDTSSSWNGCEWKTSISVPCDLQLWPLGQISSQLRDLSLKRSLLNTHTHTHTHSHLILSKTGSMCAFQKVRMYFNSFISLYYPACSEKIKTILGMRTVFSDASRISRWATEFYKDIDIKFKFFSPLLVLYFYFIDAALSSRRGAVLMKSSGTLCRHAETYSCNSISLCATGKHIAQHYTVGGMCNVWNMKFSDCLSTGLPLPF